MKHLKYIISIALIASVSTSAMAGQFRKNKRKFKSAKKINNSVFVNKIQGKTFRCSGVFSDNTSGSEYYQFTTFDEKIINNFDDNEYSINTNFIGSETRMGSEIQTFFRLTKKDELVAYQKSGITSQYIHCLKSTVTESKIANIELVLEDEIKGVAVDSSGNKVVLTTKYTGAGVSSNYTDYISLFDKDNKEVKRIEASKFIAALNLDKGLKRFPAYPELIEYNGSFYLNGGFYSSENGFKNLTLKFNKDLKDLVILIENQDGEMKINPTSGMISFYGIDHILRNGTLVSLYDNNGTFISKKHYDEMRETTGFEGSLLSDGSIVLSSYCEYDFNELYGCPQRSLNYPGLSLVSSKGAFLKFFTGFGSLDMSQPSLIKSLANDAFVVGYKGINGVITLVKYDNSGNYLDSYGIEADNETHNSLGFMPKHQHEKISITEDEMVYYYQGSRLYSFQM